MGTRLRMILAQRIGQWSPFEWTKGSNKLIRAVSRPLISAIPLDRVSIKIQKGLAIK